MKCRFALFVIVLIPIVTAHATETQQDKNPITPESVVDKALQALQESRFDLFSQAMHPEALKQFKDMMMSIVEASGLKGQEAGVLTLFHGASSAEELEEFNDQEFFLSFFKGVMLNTPDMKQILAGSKNQTVGHVLEGKDKAHVVCRTTMSTQGITITKMNVVSLQRTKTGWAMLLTGDMQGIAAALKKQFDDGE